MLNKTTKVMDWRTELRKNDRKTRLVILAFLAIYLFVGLSIDLHLHDFPQDITIGQALVLLLTFKITPFFTVVTFSLALISILVAFSFYDKIVMLGTEHKEITSENAASFEENELYNVVDELRISAGFKFIPKIFIIEAPYMNAFASGYSEKSALIAITRGLMQKLNRNELQAVMAHELNHIRHHDIKLILAASIMCNVLLIAVDIMFRGLFFSGVSSRSRRSSNSRGGNFGGGNNLFVLVLLLRFVLPVLTMLLMLFLSRTREYMADAGAVELMRDNASLANALLKIESDHEKNQEDYSRAYQMTAHEEVRRVAYIFEPVNAGIASRRSLATLFSTHPTIADRLKALGFAQKKK